jgi:hypothetical protein
MLFGITLALIINGNQTGAILILEVHHVSERALRSSVNSCAGHVGLGCLFW